ncbi:helix-turn-helix transcriptional regulator [Candidatus Saccharibacteria bacterium]|nr:helix-turn-helix transcriptional regulator [Candidatus Saccharibacteria bacterium]
MKKNYYNDFIANLKFYRAKKGFSQITLAGVCDCSNGAIGCIEAGKVQPSFDMILRLAEALEIHPADLFLRNSSSSVGEMKNRLRKKLIPQIEDFIDKEL